LNTELLYESSSFRSTDKDSKVDYFQDSGQGITAARDSLEILYSIGVSAVIVIFFFATSFYKLRTSYRLSKKIREKKSQLRTSWRLQNISLIFVMPTSKLLLTIASSVLNEDNLASILRFFEQENAESLPVLPTNILNPEDASDQRTLMDCIEQNDKYTKDMEERARYLMTVGVNTTLSHRSFHHISATLHLSSVIGMSAESFMELFTLVESKMSEAFSHSQAIANQIQVFSSSVITGSVYSLLSTD